MGTIGLALLLIFCMAASNKAVKDPYEVKFVGTNQEITLECHFGQEANKIRWLVKKNHEQAEDFAYDLNLERVPGYFPNCSLEGQYCNIRIINATREMVGSYRFEYGLNGKDGKTACRFKLVVGDLSSNSNIRSNKFLIGQSDCSIKPEKIRRSCSFKYYGDFTGPLNMVWMKKGLKNMAIDKVLAATTVEHQGDVNVLSIEDEIEVTNDMDGLIFECYLKGELAVEPSELPEIHVQYIKNATAPTMISDNDANISCSVIKSNSVHCIPRWFIQGKRNFETPDHVLTRDHLIMDGRYSCLLECHFITGITCCVQGTYFDWKQIRNITSTFGQVVGITITVVIAVVAVVIAVFIWRKYISSRNALAGHGSHQSESLSEKDSGPPLIQQMS